MIDYIINPVWMGGLVKEIAGEMAKVYLHGRLGVIQIPQRMISPREILKPGCEVKFYFSYLQVVENPYDYDSAAMDFPVSTGGEPAETIIPCLLGGRLTEVNDTAVKAEVMDGLGTVSVPRRWVFTNVVLQTGQAVEFYMSPMVIVGRNENSVVK